MAFNSIVDLHGLYSYPVYLASYPNFQFYSRSSGIGYLCEDSGNRGDFQFYSRSSYQLQPAIVLDTHSPFNSIVDLPISECALSEWLEKSFNSIVDLPAG